MPSSPLYASSSAPRWRHLSIAALALACDPAPTARPLSTPPATVVPTPMDTAPPTPVDTGSTPPITELPPCPGLSIDPPGPLIVEAGGQQFFRVSGDAGAPGFDVDPPDGGLVTASGLFTASARLGPVDVTVTDALCVGTASVAVEVVQPLQVSPTMAVVPPGGSLAVEATGGSGTVDCDLVGTAMGALSDCTFVATALEETAVVEVTDPATGARVQVTVLVDADAALIAPPSTGWMVPVGSTFDPQVDGGSGVWQIAAGDPAVVGMFVDPATGDRSLTALAAGTTELVLEDRHVSGLTLTRTFTVLPSRTPPTHASGANSENPRILHVDLDGDGFDELIVGEKDASIAAHRGGVVHVYAGTAAGPDIAAGPVWTAEGLDDEGLFGASIALGDLDGDGHPDLVVGAPNVDWIRDRVGEVSVFLGDGSGGFVQPAALLYNGQGTADRLGANVAVCDLDGDGRDDLVASAESIEPVSGVRTGAVWAYTQDALGLAATPIRRHAVRFDGTDWVEVVNGRLGTWGMAVGDVDHDGLCDVVADAQSIGWTDGARGPGYVLMFSGDDATGLSTTPTRVWHTPGDTAVAFGRSLAVGNVDGVSGPTGLPDDLLIGSSGYDGTGGNTTGRALLFTGAAGGPLERTPEDAVWSLQGAAANDQVGRAVGIAPDGDLLVTSPNDRLAWRFEGGAGFVADDLVIDALDPATLALAPVVGPGETHLWSGSAVSAWGDGVFLTTRLDVQQTDGSWSAVDVSGLHGVTADGTTTTWTLDTPSGDQFGTSVVSFDVAGSGQRELLVGGDLYAQPGQGALSGGVFAWDDVDWSPLAETGPTASNNDRRGYRLAVGDPDGDGHDDLVMASRSDARPANPTLDVTCGASVARNNVGQVSVHLSRGGAIGATPDLVWWPGASNESINDLDSGFDANGDGRDDLIVGTRGNKVVLVHGVAAPPLGEVHELCDQVVFSTDDNVDFGIQVTAIGDLDADGCDEVAMSAPNEDLGINNRGVVRVLWGFGPTCAHASATFTMLAEDRANERWGTGLDSGLDVTGDGLPDLAVSSVFRTIGGDRVGGALLVDGARIAGLATAPSVGGVVPTTPIHPLLAPGSQLLQGDQPSSDFGRSIALLSGPRLAVGMPASVLGVTGRGGGVVVHDIVAGQPVAGPSWWIPGESFSAAARFGEVLERAEGSLLIGAPGSDAGGQNHVGAAYVAPL